MSGVVELLAELVAIDSTNPGLVPGAAGEEALARFLARRLSAAGLEVDLWEPRPGRPNVVARLPGSGPSRSGATDPGGRSGGGADGRSLMIVGHTDVVGAAPEAFTPVVRGARMYGRGANDMKAGLAAMVIAAERLAAEARTAGGDSPLAGDLLIAGCADEEWESFGAEALLRRYRPSAAILPERTELDVVTDHGGFVWFEVESRGVEAAGAEPEKGVDAIALLAPVLEGIVRLDRELASRPPAAYGRGSIHAGTIVGGTQLPAYPAECRLGVERCLIAGESVAGAETELRSLLDAAKRADSRFAAELRTIVGREPAVVDPGHDVVAALSCSAEEELGRRVAVRGDIGWGDSGLFADEGIPCVQFGPVGAGEHTAEEWVDLPSVEVVARVLERTARAYCG